MPYIGSTPAETALVTDDIADDAVTLAKIASGTDGELITWDASGNPAAVGAGTSGHFLKSQGAGSVPVFAAVTNAVELVSTQSVSSVASVEFTGIDSSSDLWMVVLQGVNAATDNQIMSVRTSNDASSHSYDSGASDYNWSMTGLYFGDDYSKYDTADAAIDFGADPNMIGNDADIGLSGRVFIHKPADTALDTGITYNCYMQNGSNNFINIIGGGYRVANEAVTAIQFRFLSGNIDSGRFSMYKLAHS